MIFRVKTSLLALLAMALCATVARGQIAEGPTATVSPASAAFGVPTGSTVSAPQTVTVIASGGAVTVQTVGIAGSGDFTIATGTDGCTGQTLAAPASTCTINVIFTPTAVGLETATLNITTSANALSVALSGAKGAIKLFNEINVNASNNSAGFANPYTFNSAPLTLSCPAGATAKLSSTPDGAGNVLVDNYITLSVNGTLVPTPTGTGPAGNVCTGGPSDSFGGLQYPDCFSSTYEGAAAGSIGTNPDTMIATWGVPAIDVTADFNSSTTKATFTLLDAGGEVASSTVFLVTSCSSPGVQTGGTVTANPLDPNNPASLAPQFLFNTTPGNHITFGADFLNANQFDANSPPVTPTVTDTGISQSVFYSYVTGTSAAPATCVLLSGEVDAQGNSLCKAFTITCTDSSGVSSGANCPQQTIARTLLFEGKLDSPEAIPTFFPWLGPGLLMGSDEWTSAATCVFPSGGLFGQLCPQNPLTEFKGAADPTSGATPRSVNSTFIPVYNMPLPATLPLIVSDDIFLWQNSTTVSVKFIASPAIYFATASRPANGFIPAPIQSVTYGVTPASSPVPDPTYPIATDQVLVNPAACPSVPTPGAPLFKPPTATLTLTEGRYKLHYFATDCANTEELNFRASTGANVNWAQFKTVPINIDLGAPIVTLSLSSPIVANKPVTATFSCSDPALADGSAGSGIFLCGPYLFLGTSNTGTRTTKFTASSTGHGSFSIKATDLAGNVTTKTVNY
jgi:hypothetical protein